MIYITIEYRHLDLFSGNGICARSQVHALSNLGIQVLVICGRPQSSITNESSTTNITIKSIPLKQWFTTDINSSHHQFAQKTANILQQLQLHSFDACFAVDWTAMNMYTYLNQQTKDTIKNLSLPLIYLNFRVYSSMKDTEESDHTFYRNAESQAVINAISNNGGVVSLSPVDNHSLQNMVHHLETYQHDLFQVVLPMLRTDFCTIANRDKGQILDFQRKRMFFVSLVRLSEDKGPHRFVNLLESIQRHDPHFWSRTGIVPLLCGAESQPEYAKHLKARLTKNVPECLIMDTFLGSEQLALLLQNSVLNFHPALYEAYGMTIIEAAAMGCPSIVHHTGIGAMQLLPQHDSVESVDVNDPIALMNCVKTLLHDPMRRKKIAENAYDRAVGWTEVEHVKALLNFVQHLISKRQKL